MSDDGYYAQSATACCPRETIPDSCSCPDGCECMCRDCTCPPDDPEWTLTYGAEDEA